MQAADGFVLSSRWEGLPMGLMEAAACGLPAVGTDVAGTREVIADGETGWLAPVGSSKALAEKMSVAMSLKTEERLAMGERARRRVVERYDLERAVDCWEALYRELLDKNPLPRRWARGK
jgi:glycosyltransferase involved in cell wall biosynthesis